MIIVEGPDGAGKTRLVDRLCAEFRMEREPRVVSKQAEAMVDLRNWLENDLDSWPKKAIYDRHRLISEPIYAPILRGSLNEGFENLGWLADMYMDFQVARPILVYCLPPLGEVRKNLQDDPDNEVVRDHIDAIYWAYHCRVAADYHRENIAVWDYTQHLSFKILTYWIKQQAKERFDFEY